MRFTCAVGHRGEICHVINNKFLEGAFSNGVECHETKRGIIWVNAGLEVQSKVHILSLQLNL